MSDYKFRHTISRAAVTAAHQFLYRQPVDPDDYARTDPVAEMLDRALASPGGEDSKEEVLNTTRPETVTYVTKLRLDRFVLIGVLVHESASGFKWNRWSGESGLILITVVSLNTAARFVRDETWQSIDGKPILQPSPELERLATPEPVLPSAPIPTADSPGDLTRLGTQYGDSGDSYVRYWDIPALIAAKRSAGEECLLEVLTQTCVGECGRNLPATEDHFYRIKKDKKLRKKCKECYKRERNEYRRGVVSSGSATEVALPDHEVTNDLSHRRIDTLRALFAREADEITVSDAALNQLESTRREIREVLGRLG